MSDNKLNGYAHEDSGKSAFAEILPDEPTTISASMLRLPANQKHTQFVELTNEHVMAKAIFAALAHAFSSVWFNKTLNDQGRLGYYKALRTFMPWFNSISFNNYHILIIKDFEVYRVNSFGVKTQSSYAKEILKLLKEGRATSRCSPEQLRFIDQVIKSTKLARDVNRTSVTLTLWFTRNPWIHKYLGNRYLKLESPKRLISSMQVTVATTLLYILEAKKSMLKSFSSNLSELVPHSADFSQWSKSQQFRYANKLLQNFAQFENQRPVDTLTNCIWIDVITKQQVNGKSILEYIEKNGVENMGRSIIVNGRKIHEIFRTPKQFAPSCLETATTLEQMLFAWLCAGQTIQPEDVWKLKKNNIAIERNNKGRVIYIHFVYYKGRCGSYQETALINGNNVIAKAILAYVNFFPSADLFQNKLRAFAFNNPFYIHKAECKNTESGFLLSLWGSPHFRSYLDKELIKQKISCLFIDAMMIIVKYGGTTHNHWSIDQKNKLNQGLLKSIDTSIPNYLESSEHPVPQTWFHLEHIKTSTVHSNADKYRDEDLINWNSHTSVTEKLSYLTDDNKDWINQVNRITRLVLHDIENYVYKPNLSAVDIDVHDMTVSTQITKATQNSAFSINHLGQAEGLDTPPECEIDDLLVIDSEETALTMLHYIAQADQYKDLLLTHNPEFFTRTVLVNIEWMHNVLTRLDPLHVNQAHNTYKKLKKYLPALFESEVSGGVTT